MTSKRLDFHAWVVLSLNALYTIANALCSIFVGVYFWKNSLDFTVVCYHYLALFLVTPVVFLLAGWYSQARDRVHVFRLGLALHAVFYACLLYLGEDSPRYAPHLGALLGVTWGFFWAGNNTFNFDVAKPENRDYYFGWLGAINGAARLAAPMAGGLLIGLAPDAEHGYQLIFFLAVLIYGAGIVLSAWVPADSTRRPFRLKRALFPGRDQHDWQWVMLAAVTLAGSFNIFHFLLALVMYMQTSNEVTVGGFAAFQALAAIVTSYLLGRLIVPRQRRTAMLWGVILLVTAGVLISAKLTVFTLVVFGFLRSVAQPLFSIPHWGVRFESIDRCAEDPSQRIEYLSAWEVPLAIGRVLMIGLLAILYETLGDTGMRIALFLLCANRILTYLCLIQISSLRREP